MEIITIASAKGGVSKSLLAINLFDYLKNEEQKKVLLIDTDKQQSAFDFLEELGEEDISTAHTEQEIKEVLKLAKAHHYDFVVIDTAPTITPLNALIIQLSSKVMIAVKPARFDIKSVYNTVDLVKQSNAKSCILFTQTINTSTNTKKNIEELQDIFKNENINVINSTLSNSVVYVNSINDLKPIFRTKHTKQKIELTKIFASLLTI
ncbi:TPA: ParA family protein [Pasteurella multocida]|nr:ParA family protein [Pasteurella multocida]HEA3307761.1 ParA family protein [Pasteurella multocida]